MADDSIILSIDSGIARITLNRPNKLNSFNANAPNLKLAASNFYTLSG